MTAPDATLATLSGAFNQAAAGLTTIFGLAATELELLDKMQTVYETELPSEDHPDYDRMLAERDDALAWLSEQFLDNDQIVIAKTERYIGLLWTLDRMEQMFKDRAKEIRENAAVVERHADRVRARLLAAMQVMERPRIDTPNGSARIQANPGRVEVLEPIDVARVEGYASKPVTVPAEFVSSVTVWKVDKRRIAAWIKSTNEVPAGVQIVKSDSLRIS